MWNVSQLIHNIPSEIQKNYFFTLDQIREPFPDSDFLPLACEKINVISPFKFFRDFRKTSFETKSQFSSAHEHLEISEFPEL